jgi:hypothetical protein
VQGLDHQVSDLGHQMRVLHEETLDRIKALAPDFSQIRREFRQADADLKESIDRRLDPIELWIRSRDQKG